MNKLNLKKTLRAGIFAATIMALAPGGAISAGNLAPASIKITSVAGGGNLEKTIDPTKAVLGALLNLVARGDSLLFTFIGEPKLKRLYLTRNKLSTQVFKGIGAGETPEDLIAANDDKYYFKTRKDIGNSKAYALYEADSEFKARHIVGKNDAMGNGFVDNDRGILTFINPSNHGVLYNDGANDLLFFIDGGKIRKVTLSGDYPTSTVNADSVFSAERLALKGDKLIVTDKNNSLIFEHDLKTGLEKIIAGGLKDANGAYIKGYENAENPLQAKLNLTSDIAISPAGNIYFTDHKLGEHFYLKVLRKLEASNGVYGAITTVYGAAPGSMEENTGLYVTFDLEFIGNNLYAIEWIDLDRSIIKIEFINQTP